MAESYSYKGLGCGYRCRGGKPPSRPPAKQAPPRHPPPPPVRTWKTYLEWTGIVLISVVVVGVAYYHLLHKPKPAVTAAPEQPRRPELTAAPRTAATAATAAPSYVWDGGES